MLIELRKELKNLADSRRAKGSAYYFKTGEGEYGHGDVFIGITVPQSRALSKKYYKELTLSDIKKLLKSKIHEERLLALQILRLQFEKGSVKDKELIVKYYLQNTRYVNNWDLVDSSAHQILGVYLLDKKPDILYKLARSENIWERRIAIVSTYQYITTSKFEHTFKISKILLSDEHNLIHKAVGWMLREAGKKDQKKLEAFLKKHYAKLPRTTLRYAIEKFDEPLRRVYIEGKAV